MNKNIFNSGRLLQLAAATALTLAVGNAMAFNPQLPVTAALTINTTEGPVRGVQLDGMQVFRGIPYAAAPVGDLRLAPPAAPQRRRGVLELGENFASDCLQVNIAGQVNGSEDCLYLNVYTPKADAGTLRDRVRDRIRARLGLKRRDAGLPVMVWIHGGAFVMGSGGAEYDPKRLVDNDVIVVTLNYRLGNLGFLAHPGLASDAGNFGLMDQQQALRWVRNNIAQFGGNPDNVTLFGESAGGHSVLSHIVSPQAKQDKLFRRAIVQSGSYAPFQQPKALAQFTGVQTASALGCTDVGNAASCLRSLPAATFLAAQGSQALPSVDPDSQLLPLSIQDALASGQFNTDVDVMLGTNLDEGTLFVALDELSNGLVPLEAMGETEYRKRVQEFFAPYQAVLPFDDQAIANEYLQRYATSSSPFSLALSGIWTDFTFACNSFVQTSTFAANGLNTWQYWFRDRNAPWTLVPPAVPVAPGVVVPLSFPQGASHASEIPYVLYPERVMRERYTGDQADLEQLAGNMVEYWTSFAHDGNPNSSAAPVWQPAALGAIQQLDAGGASSGSVMNFLGVHNCGFWSNPPLTGEYTLE